jgi:hypothetical protein
MSTFTQIGTAQVVGSGGASNIVFSSIPSTYTDLVLYLSLRTNGTTGPGGICRTTLQVNSTTTGYNNYLLYNITTDAPAGANGTDKATFFYSSADTAAVTNAFGISTIYICNYADGTLPKTISMDSGVEGSTAASGMRALNAAYLTNTNAITSLTITPSDAVLFNQNSSAYLYGVSNA